MKITAPVEGYTRTDHYGTVALEFKDGVAEYDTSEHGELPPGVRSYLVGAGYGIGKTKPTSAQSDVVEPDPHAPTHEQVGTTLRDAAVDPQEHDFLPPVNAGNSDGKPIVAPGIHAVGTGPIVPGPVGRFEEDGDGSKVVIPDTEVQQERETTAAEKVFIDREPVQDVTEQLGEDVGQPPPSQEVVENDEKVDAAPAEDLKGAALDEALEAAGLTKTGTADEKRARLAEHQAQG